jgi:hypothetical protein
VPDLLKEAKMTNQELTEILKDLLEETEDMRTTLALNALPTSYTQLEAISSAKWAISELEQG